MSGNGVSERTGVARGGFIRPGGLRGGLRETRRDAGAVDLLTGSSAKPAAGSGSEGFRCLYRNRRLVFP